MPPAGSPPPNEISPGSQDHLKHTEGMQIFISVTPKQWSHYGLCWGVLLPPQHLTIPSVTDPMQRVGSSTAVSTTHFQVVGEIWHRVLRTPLDSLRDQHGRSRVRVRWQDNRNQTIGFLRSRHLSPVSTDWIPRCSIDDNNSNTCTVSGSINK